MATHRRIKQARKVVKKFRKFVTWVKRGKKRVSSRWRAFNQRGDRLGKVHCQGCNKWIHKDWVAEHIASHQKGKKPGMKKPGAKPVTSWGPWNVVPQPTKSAPVAPPQKKAPAQNQQQKQKTSKNGAKVPTTQSTQKSGGKPMSGSINYSDGRGSGSGSGDEGTDTPHAGNDEVSSWFSQWSSRYPSNYEVNHMDAESMGEMWHAVADAFRRKAQMLVEENHFPPSIVEPYEECATHCAQIADLHKEMADRTETTFKTLIEAMQGPVPRDTDFAKPR